MAKNNKTFLSITPFKLVSIVVILVLIGVAFYFGFHKSQPISKEPESIQMAEATGVDSSPLNIYYTKPSQWTADRPIMIVLPGINRKAKEECLQLTKTAETYNILIVVPDFTKEKYPGNTYYNLGHLVNTLDQKELNAPTEWTLPAINHIAATVTHTFNSTGPIYLFGHSAGAQLASRYLLFDNSFKFTKIIITNAGWYTTTNNEVNFPYGLANTHLSEDQLKTSLSRPTLILLGQNDTDKNAPYLQHNFQMDKQGLFRLARGQYFYTHASDTAKELKSPFNWQMKIVENVGHSDRQMAEAAIKEVITP